MSYKYWIFIAVFLFVIGLIFGLATPTGTFDVRAEDIADLTGFVDLLDALPGWALFIAILVKNVTAIMISFILSPVLCLMPIIALALNGWLIGLVSNMVLQEESLGFLLAGLVPHGIFEIPAFIIGEAVALNFGAMVIIALFKKETRENLGANLRQNLKYLGIALALLLPAAIIETYVTPMFLR